MVNFPIPHDGIIAASKIGFYISSELYFINENMLLTLKKQILSEWGVFSYEEFEKKVVLSSEKNIYFNNLLKKNKKHNCKIISRFCLYKLLNMIDKKLLDISFFLPGFIDNRGRQY